MLDIDHFKQINDRFGHQQGDRALQRFCACVAAQLRADDLFVRSGGEEFLILLPGMSEPDLLALAERIRAAVAALPADPAALPSAWAPPWCGRGGDQSGAGPRRRVALSGQAGGAKPGRPLPGGNRRSGVKPGPATLLYMVASPAPIYQALRALFAA